MQLLYSFMKYDYEKLISLSFREFYKLSIIYSFAGTRRVLTELEADNRKHRSNYTVACKVGALLMSERRAKRGQERWGRKPIHEETSACLRRPLLQNLPTFNLSLNRPIKIVPEVK